MGKVKQLWQDERDARWQRYYNECRNEGMTDTEAWERANDCMEVDDEKEGLNRGP